jgi:hypothetical protein
MRTKNAVYRTVTGRTVDLATLNVDERACLATVVAKYRAQPEWTRFGAWWMKELSKRDIPESSVLYRICDDLEARLGIAQGKAAPPDYRHYLLALIEEHYGSRYKFCKATGIDQGQLSRILSGKADFSIEALGNILRVLQASLVIQTEDAVREAASPEAVSEILEMATR